MSFAVAANSSDAFDATLVGGVDKNVNMEAVRDQANLGWPRSRTRSSWGERWLHSDFRSVALPFVYPIYEVMLDIEVIEHE